MLGFPFKYIQSAPLAIAASENILALFCFFPYIIFTKFRHRNWSLRVSNLVLPPSPPYRVSFIAAPLLLPPSKRLVDLYSRLQDWSQVRKTAMQENLVQARVLQSQERITGELVRRLAALRASELDLFPALSPREQPLLLWLAICRHYQFVGDFACDVLYENFASLKKIVSPADFNVFFNRQTQWHDKLASLADSTRNKMRQALFLIMRQAGLLDKKGQILPVCASQELRQLLITLPGREQLFFPGNIR